MGMIFGMLAVGQGLDNSGAVKLIVDAVAPFLKELPPIAALVVYFSVWFSRNSCRTTPWR